MANAYVYAVTRVHFHEQRLLSVQDFERMLERGSAAEAQRYLSEKGWGSSELPAGDAGALADFELNRTWAFIGELVDDLSELDTLRVAADYHNLKAAIKLDFSGGGAPDSADYYVHHGTLDADVLERAAAAHDFSSLPEALAKAGQAAYEALAHTGNGQACDIEIDHAALLAVAEAGKKTKSAVLRRYAEQTVDTANIKAAVRCSRMGRDHAFMARVIAPAGTLDTAKLMAAAEAGPEDIYQYLAGTAYAEAVEALKHSLSAFERFCDNRLMASLRPQRLNYFTLEPLAAYLLARENEIRMVRLILSALENHFDSDTLRERLRETYV